MDENEARLYEKVKMSLLEHYNLTAEGFREKFRNSRHESGEKVSQFRVRLIGYWDKWLEMAKKDKRDAEEVADVILQEQLMNMCSHQLRVFLKERKLASSQEFVSIAEMFVEAHGQSAAFARPKTTVSVKESVVSIDTLKAESGAKKSMECHKCGKHGHWARDCWMKGHKGAVATVCTFCRKEGHTEDRCRRKNGQQKIAAVTVGETCIHGTTTPSLSCGCAVPMLTAACRTVNSGNRMPIVHGMVNGKTVEVLRDSGCSCVVVSRDLIGPVNPSAPRTVTHLANGKAEVVPVERVTIDCPFYKGTVEAIVMDSPLYDVIVGNTPEAKCPGIVTGTGCQESRPAPDEQEKRKERVKEVAQAVETRQAASRPIKKLKAPDTIDIRVTKGDLIKLQSEDVSLHPLRKLAQSGETRKSGASNESLYGTEKGVLMRYFRSPKVNHGDPISQVVVPTQLRQKVMCLGHENIGAGHLAAKKTAERILAHFNWPNLWNDVYRYCQSCDQCQKSVPKGKRQKVPMEKMPMIGLMKPVSERGHMVGSGKMFPTIDKLEAIRDAKPPRTKKEMRSFLGLASFYQRYVPNFAAITSPLTDATKKGKPNVIQWEEAQTRAYKALTGALISHPVLRLPDFGKPFLLQTDASDKGLGAILLQEYDGERFPVVFLSRKLSPPEENYSVVEKECLALVWAVKSLDTYLQGREFVVLTDHVPLLYLNKAKNDNGRLMRWAPLLHQYRFRIESIRGKDNHGPDFLSRILDQKLGIFV